MTQEKAPRGHEASRLWIMEEAERLCVPAFMTPRWRSLYARDPDLGRTPEQFADEQAEDEQRLQDRDHWS